MESFDRINLLAQTKKPERFPINLIGNRSSGELKALTSIRGVAVVWVVLHHLTLYYRCPRMGPVSLFFFTGSVGVDIFFVLSGFILTLVYWNLSPAGLKKFALRRIFRIYPLHLTVLATLALLCLFPRIRALWGADWQDLPAVALLVQPFFLDHAAWNGPTWSAGIEMSCYLAFPILLFAARRLPAAALICLLPLTAYAEYRVQVLYQGTWFGLPSFLRGLGAFGFGMNLGLIPQRFNPPPKLHVPAELLAAAILMGSCILRDTEIIPLAAGVMIWILASGDGPVAKALSIKPLVFIGAISFSIYLIHLPIADLFNLVWPIVPHPPLDANFLLRESLYFAVVLAVSSMTYRVIEEPGRRFVSGRRASMRNEMKAMVPDGAQDI
jgi:peptidoglycan/LPS O-acetylase OafA/YrhL